jgi:hypothetical protein
MLSGDNSVVAVALTMMCYGAPKTIEKYESGGVARRMDSILQTVIYIQASCRPSAV